MNDVCRFSRDHVVECSERTVLSCLEPVCLCWRRFGRYFSHQLAKSDGWPADFMHQKYLPKRRQHKQTGSRQDKAVLLEHSTTKSMNFRQFA